MKKDIRIKKNTKEDKSDMPKELPEHTVYIGNLSYSHDEDSIKQFFMPYGYVRYVKLMKEGRENKSRGMAFVAMGDEKSVQKAVSALNGKVQNGRTLKASKAKPLKNKKKKAPAPITPIKKRKPRTSLKPPGFIHK